MARGTREKQLNRENNGIQIYPSSEAGGVGAPSPPSTLPHPPPRGLRATWDNQSCESVISLYKSAVDSVSQQTPLCLPDG